MTLDEIHRIKTWHVAHRRDHPVEYHFWDAVLTLWLMGWVGWIPALAFGAIWLAPLLVVGSLLPSLYVAWRMKAHRQHRLRCDWVRTVQP